jgi:hypothetical protein
MKVTPQTRRQHYIRPLIYEAFQYFGTSFSLMRGVSELRCEVIVRFVDICTHAIVAINVYSVRSSSVEDRGFETRSIRSIYRLYNLYLLILR